jgi:aspartokinase-like uncharacterized kinase
MKGAPFRWDAVVKVGGSLGRRRGRLEPILRGLAGAGRRRRLLVVPGGGLYADLVRSELKRLDLDESGAHRMALLGMDLYGLSLAQLCRGARPVRTLDAARRVAERGGVPILLAAALVEKAKRLERSFRLTSDSIAAWVARRSGAARLVLLKCADLPEPRPLSRRDAGSLAARGIVDPLFPSHLPRRSETWVIDARRAGGLATALGDGAGVPDGGGTGARGGVRPRRSDREPRAGARRARREAAPRVRRRRRRRARR